MNKSRKSGPMRLTTENVQKVLSTCLCDGTVTKPVIVEGYVRNFAFDQNKLAVERQHIEEMISELPEEFTRGNSFMEMYTNRHGEQWAGTIKPMEELMALGIAVGKISYMQPRNIWWSLPGGMPNIVIK